MASKVTLFLAAALAVLTISQIQAGEPSATELATQVLESLQKAAKNAMEVASSLPEDLEKDKYYQSLKSNIHKALDYSNDAVKKYSKDSSALIEDLKATLEKIQKQLPEILKKLKDKETQAKVEKIRETYIQAVKKLLEQERELAKYLGLYDLVPSELKDIVHNAIEEGQKLYEKAQQKLTEIISEERRKP